MSGYVVEDGIGSLSLAVALGTDACDSRQCRLDSLLFDYLLA